VCDCGVGRVHDVLSIPASSAMEPKRSSATSGCDHVFSEAVDGPLADKKSPSSLPAFSQTYDTNLSVGRARRCSSLWPPLGALSTCFCPLPLTVSVAEFTYTTPEGRQLW